MKTDSDQSAGASKIVTSYGIPATDAVANFKLPTFWQRYLEFSQVKINRIATDISKFNIVVPSLESSVLDYVVYTVEKLPPLNKCGELKRQLIVGFADINEHRSTKVLT